MNYFEIWAFQLLILRLELKETYKDNSGCSMIARILSSP